ncbi:MAG: EAL domain-containing protein [Gammaproteobacteria bacterium]|nr:EAL domain-containing protein [Gammaproteobacteria bacterium]
MNSSVSLVKESMMNLPEIASAVVKSAETGVIVLDEQKNIVFLNNWLLQYSGVTFEQAKGKSLADVFSGIKLGRINSSLDDAIDLGMSSLLSQTLNKAPFPLYGDPIAAVDDKRLQQAVLIKPLTVAGRRYAFIQITDVSMAVARDKLLREQVRINQDFAERYQKSEEYTQAILSNTPDGIVTLNESGEIKISNKSLEALYDYTAEELQGFKFSRLFPEPFASGLESYLKHASGLSGSGSSIIHKEYEGLRKDGSVFPLDLALARVKIDQTPIYIATVKDITLRKTTESALFEEKELAEATLQSIGDGVLTTSIFGEITYVNSSAEGVIGVDLVQAIGKKIDDVLDVRDGETNASVPSPIFKCIKQAQVIEYLRYDELMLPDGRKVAIHQTASPIRNLEGQIIGAVLVFRDVSVTHELEQQLSYQASHDALTGLANRLEFERRLKEMYRSAHEENKVHALLYLDLDQFKIVNDTCGHVAGDELLRQITTLLQEQVRDTDLLARLGGDEFGVLMNSCPIEPAERIANNMRKLIEDYRFGWGDQNFSIGVSIGLVPLDNQSQSMAEVLSSADSACYAAKDGGRNRVHVFQLDDIEMAERKGEMQWISRITAALEEDRFVLYFQPIAQVKNAGEEDCTHGEVLVRMLAEDGSIIPPGAFIPAAERYDLMTKIDRWVIDNTFDWIVKNEGLFSNVMFSINLSGQSLTEDDLYSFIANRLGETGIDPNHICFEVTETAAIANLSKALSLIGALKQRGCLFSLDDFGSGLSSFGYLKELPVDFLKIDGAFVKDIATDPIDRVMVEAINSVGHVMGLKTIAEFVENDEILNILKEIGVDYAQGYGIAKPAPLPMNK